MYLIELMRKKDLKCDNSGVRIREAYLMKLLCECGCVLGQDLENIDEGELGQS